MLERITNERLDELPKLAVRIRRRTFRLSVVPIRTLEHEDGGYIFGCPVSIGALGYETPPGHYWILDKEAPPTYTAPDEEWAREAGYEPGDKLPADHHMNPLRGAWLRLTWDGIGIHGSESWPLGKKASHGCIRVRPDDAVTLHRLLPVGTPVVVL